METQLKALKRFEKIMKKKFVQVPPRFELGSLDSESKVLTITPWDRCYEKSYQSTQKTDTITTFNFLSHAIAQKNVTSEQFQSKRKGRQPQKRCGDPNRRRDAAHQKSSSRHTRLLRYQHLVKILRISKSFLNCPDLVQILRVGS